MPLCITPLQRLRSYPEQNQKRKFRKMPVDAHAILRDGLAGIADLPRLMESANIEERKLVMQAFIAGITVRPDEARLDLLVRPLPLTGTASSTARLVAGARFVPVQVKLQPEQRYVVVPGPPRRSRRPRYVPLQEVPPTMSATRAGRGSRTRRS